MSFGRPEFLWLLLLLILPLVLYLLPLPRRQVKSSALFLWQRFLASQRFGGVSDRFRRALGFALLAMILICLVLAAADLSIGSPSSDADRVVVLIDNSASMQAVSGGKSNLEHARQQAAGVVRSLNSSTSLAVAEAADKLNVIVPMPSSPAEQPGKDSAALAIENIQPFEGAVDMKRMLAEAYRLWGGDGRTSLLVFTDAPLPASPWGPQASVSIAQAGGDNAGFVGLSCRRQGKQIHVQYTLGNFAPAARTLAGSVLVNGQPPGQLEAVDVPPGQTVQRMVTLEEPGQATIELRLPHGDSLACDDSAFALVPALDDMRVNVVWPEAVSTGPHASGVQTRSGGDHADKKRNEYVWAVLTALQSEGAAGPVTEQAAGGPPVTVYVNQLPAAWPEGNAIVLYPLKSGVIEVTGLHADSLTVTRQADDALLADVDLRGLEVKAAVQAPVPAWAKVLVWGGDRPLVWAGQTGVGGKTKVLFVGIPVMPTGSRLPMVSSFPVLIRNALKWMLPQASVMPVGASVSGCATRQAGIVSASGVAQGAVSTLSAVESDLRRKLDVRPVIDATRRSLAAWLVVLAMALLPAEWALFHKLVTE